MSSLTHVPIDIPALLTAANAPHAGGIVLFLGTTREFTEGRQTVTLDYEAYEEMALKKLAELESWAQKEWGLTYCHIVHRLGSVPIGEASVAIVAASPHRAAAFSAAQWLIDTLKRDVPIWKREQWSDGSVEWIHPR